MANTFGVVSPNYQKIVAGSQLGTRSLQFLEVAAVENNSAVDFTKAVLAGTGAYTDSQSLMAKAVNAIQGFAEVYIVGAPSATEFVVVVASDTANDGTASDYSSMEAAIDAAIGIGTGTHSVTITELALDGDDLS